MDRSTNPFEEIERLFDEMAELGKPGTSGRTPVDVIDEGEAVTVVVDLPGFETDDIDVQLQDDGRLHVAAERDERHESTDEEFVRRERTRSRVSRTVSLPGTLDETDTEASYENGVLTVRLGKQTDDESTGIPVN